MRLDFRWLKKLKATGQYELIQPYKKSYSSNDNSKVMTFRLSGTFGRIVRESLIKLYCILHVQYQFDKRYWYCKHEACGWKTFKRFYSPFTVAWLEATVTILGSAQCAFLFSFWGKSRNLVCVVQSEPSTQMRLRDFTQMRRERQIPK